MIRRRPPTASLLLWALAGLLPLAAVAADAAFGRTVTMMTGRHDQAEVTEWRTLRDPADDPAEIYGQPLPGGPTRVFLVPGPSGAPLVSMPEDATRQLLFVDEGHPPPRMRTGPLLTWSIGVGALLWAVGAALAARRRAIASDDRARL